MSEEARDAFLDKEIEKGEIAKFVRKLKNNKTGVSDGIVGKLLKYGGAGMVDLLEQLFGRWKLSLGNGETALLLIFLRKGIERILVIIGVSPYSVFRKVICKILNNRLVQCLDKGALHEGQVGLDLTEVAWIMCTGWLRLNRGCMDNVYTLNEIVQGRLREDKNTMHSL